MSFNRDIILLQDIIESASHIEAELTGSTVELFATDWRLNRACRYGLLTITEATKNLSDALKLRHPNLPWMQIKSLGDRLRHEYHRIDDRVLWDTIHISMPQLISICSIELGQLKKS